MAIPAIAPAVHAVHVATCWPEMGLTGYDNQTNARDTEASAVEQSPLK
jgi:hypothetical protein